jgi:predicted transcriptional regulator
MTKKITQPTESELEILQILWQNGPSTVRFVNNQLNELREVGYTTTLKLMQIMTDKSLVSRDTSRRQHVYHSAFTETTTQRQLLNSFLEGTFRGSAKKLVLQALGQYETTKEELEEIKALISKLEKEK